MKSIFFIAVYNQIKEFPQVLEELKIGVPCETILIVNNGSNDGSEEIIRKSSFPFIDLSQNMGVGFGYIAALDWALERDYDIFGGLAGNGKMLPQEMDRVIDPLIKNVADYVTGSRFLSGGASPNLPLFRYFSIPLVNTFVKIITGANLTDATCGYRAFKLDIIRKAKFDWHAQWLYKYSFEPYLYAKVLLNMNIRWKEVPITMRYPNVKSNYSKIRPIIDWWDILKPWIIAKYDQKEILW